MVFGIFNSTNVFKNHIQGSTLEEKALNLFKEVYSYDDLKINLYRAIESEHNVNVLLVGPPATSKTLFIRCMYENLKNCVYIDVANASGRGIIDNLSSNRNTKYILLDEIDKLKKNEQSILFNLLETGEINVNLKSEKIKFKMNNPIVFGTSNSKERLTKPLFSRFQSYFISEYTNEEFILVSENLLLSKFHFSSFVADMIAKRLLSYGSKDIRKVLQIAKLIRPTDGQKEVMSIIDTFLKYQDEGETEFNY
jgi:replication-associated recombination protein RarA